GFILCHVGKSPGEILCQSYGRQPYVDTPEFINGVLHIDRPAIGAKAVELTREILEAAGIMEKVKNPVGAIFHIAILQKVAAVAQVKIQITSERDLVVAQQIAEYNLCQPVGSVIRRKAAAGIDQVGSKFQAIFFGNIASVVGTISLQVKI